MSAKSFMKKLRDSLENRRGGVPADLVKPFQEASGTLLLENDEAIEVPEDIKDMFPGKLIRVKAAGKGSSATVRFFQEPAEVSQESWFGKDISRDSAEEIRQIMAKKPVTKDFLLESQFVEYLKATIAAFRENYGQTPAYVNITSDEFQLLEGMISRSTGRAPRSKPNGTEKFEGVSLRLVNNWTGERTAPANKITVAQATAVMDAAWAERRVEAAALKQIQATLDAQMQETMAWVKAMQAGLLGPRPPLQPLESEPEKPKTVEEAVLGATGRKIDWR